MIFPDLIQWINWLLQMVCWCVEKVVWSYLEDIRGCISKDEWEAEKDVKEAG